MQPDILVKEQFKPMENINEYRVDNSMNNLRTNQNNYQVNNNQQRIYQPQPINQRVVTNLQRQAIQPQQVIRQNQMYQSTQMYNGKPVQNLQRPITNMQPVTQNNQS